MTHVKLFIFHYILLISDLHLFTCIKTYSYNVNTRDDTIQMFTIFTFFYDRIEDKNNRGVLPFTNTLAIRFTKE